MKNRNHKISFLTLLLIFSFSFSYQLESKWLDTRSAYNPYSIFYDDWMSDAMSESLSVDSDILFDFAQCLSDVDIDSITFNNGGLNSVGNPLVRYSGWYIYNSVAYDLGKDAYGVTLPPINSNPERRHSFEITINDSTFFPWDKDGGGFIDSLGIMHGGVDVNTVCRHELCHGMGIFHEPWEYIIDENLNPVAVSLHNTLMMDGTPAQAEKFQAYNVGVQETNALKALYSPPSLVVVNNEDKTIFLGDSITFEIEAPIDTRLDNILYGDFDADSLFHGYIKYPYDEYSSFPYEYYHSLLSGYVKLPKIAKLIEFTNEDCYIAKTSFTFKPDSIGEYKFKVYTTMKWNQQALLELYEQHNRPYSEITFQVMERKCRVDKPLPASESWLDFEERLNIEGTLLAEPSFADSLSNVKIIYDILDDYNSALYEMPISVFAEYYDYYFSCDSTAYFCEFTKDAKSKQREYKPVSSDVLEQMKKRSSRKFIELSKFQSAKNSSKDITEYSIPPVSYPHSLDLYPGTYTVHMMAIRKDLWDANETISEIAKCDSLQFIIPQWKMKLRRDYWYQEKVPYTQIREYEKTKIMQIILWRPWFWGPYNSLDLNIIRETDSVSVQNFPVDFNTKAAYDLLEWEIPGETVPGFYAVKAENMDYHFSINVTQNILTQVCPLYLSWENSGDWPLNWPGGEDTDDWKMHLAEAWTPSHGYYALSAIYDTEANTGLVELTSSTLSIDSEWDRVLEFAIGLPKSIGVTNFDPLLANYSIATSKDGANWTIEKTADINEYTSLVWQSDSAYCFIKKFKPLGKVNDLRIKFIKKGIVTTPPDTQRVLFDEVKVDFTKEPAKPAPSDPQATYAGGNVDVGWSAPAKGTKALDNYYVYRNGIKIGETTETIFVDATAEVDKFYNYSITAHHDDGSLFPESPMLDCSISIYTGLYAPSNLVITNENPNIKLTWSPVSGASEYKVYSSNDPYGTFAEDTSGTFDGEEWIAPLSSSRLFYYVVAVSTKEEKHKIAKVVGKEK